MPDLDMSTEEGRKAFLTSIGVNPDGASLAAEVVPEADAKPTKAKKDKGDKPKNPSKKPKKVAKEVTVTKTKDVPVTQPADPNDIVFDASLLDGFVLDGSDMKAASDKVFAAYKYPRKDPRNSLLHRLITEFINRVKRDRNPKPSDGHIKGKVKASKGERNLAQMIAQAGITADDLAVMLDALAKSKS